MNLQRLEFNGGITLRYASIALSALFALVYLLLIGFTTLRAEAVTTGAVLGWDNTLISVANIGSPWLHNLVMAVYADCSFFGSYAVEGV